MNKLKKAFVIMPFSNPFNEYYENIYKPALENFNYIVKRVDELAAPHSIMSDIQKSILEADLLLCEMSAKNPNVFYELGLAHAIGKPVILISRTSEEIPFDFKQIRIILYNDSDENKGTWRPELREKIMKAVIAIENSIETSIPVPISSLHHTAKPEISSEYSISPSFFPPLLHLFRIKYREKIEIILPSYANERHQNSGFLNYPMNQYESAFDDVYCTFRILSTLELYSGFQNVQCKFDLEAEKQEILNSNNLILIGSSVSNKYTEEYLNLTNPHFKFGEKNTAFDHDIIDTSGKVRYTPLFDNRGGKKYYKKDYALLSSLRLHQGAQTKEKRIVILAGIRAYGQVGLGDFLASSEMVKILLDFIPEVDYQCVLGFDIDGRKVSFGSIEEVWHRLDINDEWEHKDVTNIQKSLSQKKSTP